MLTPKTALAWLSQACASKEHNIRSSSYHPALLGCRHLPKTCLVLKEWDIYNLLGDYSRSFLLIQGGFDFIKLGVQNLLLLKFVKCHAARVCEEFTNKCDINYSRGWWRKYWPYYSKGRLKSQKNRPLCSCFYLKCRGRWLLYARCWWWRNILFRRGA